ncbi:MAG: helix-turn-helix domain-containing protein [Ruthenibacterium lactatiformans]
MNLAKRMAYLKKRDGLTTEMLSQRSGVATGTLNKLLNGATRRPALETMERVARAFGVPVRYFTDAAVLGTEFEVGAYVEEQGMFAISARERDMLEMLRELSTYERDFFTKTLETMYEMRAEHREGSPTRELFCYLPSFPMDSAVSIGTMTAQRIRVRDCPAAREADFAVAMWARRWNPCIPRALCWGCGGERALHGEIGVLRWEKRAMSAACIRRGAVPPGHDQPQRIQRYGARGNVLRCIGVVTGVLRRIRA